MARPPNPEEHSGRESQCRDKAYEVTRTGFSSTADGTNRCSCEVIDPALEILHRACGVESSYCNRLRTSRLRCLHIDRRNGIGCHGLPKGGHAGHSCFVWQKEAGV